MTPLPATAADRDQESLATQFATNGSQGTFPGNGSLARVIEMRIDALRRRIALQSAAIPNGRGLSDSEPFLCERQQEVMPRTRGDPNILLAQLRDAAIQARLRQAFVATANRGGLSNFDRNLQLSSIGENGHQRSVAIPSSSMRTRVEDSSHHASSRAGIIAELERRLILAALRRNTSHR
jgi:hypothetical protein